MLLICNRNYPKSVFFIGATAPQWARAPSFTRFLDHTMTHPQSVGLLWTSDQLVAQTSTWQHTTLTTDKLPCPRWDSNPQPSRRAAAGLRLRPRGRWDRHLKSIVRHTFLILYVCHPDTVFTWARLWGIHSRYRVGSWYISF